MIDGTGTSSWGWDSLHRMVSYTNGNGAQVQWLYNLRNLVTTIKYPGALNVTRGYDNAGRWTSVQDWNSNTTSFGYDANSNLTTETFPATSSVVDTFTFNAADQMPNVASAKGGNTTLFSAGYTRDLANQLTSDSSAASGTGSYKYTALNQLCYAGSSNGNACSSPPTGSIAYKYDAADNLIQKGSTTQQAFNSADELCWTASSSASCASPPSGATTYQYDSRGNRTSVNPSGGQAQTLTYDQGNRLVKYAAASTTSYGYNGDGLRVCKYAGSSTQPCSAVGAIQFLWDLIGLIPLLLKDGATAYIYGPGGAPLEQVNATATYWYHHDQIGSTRLITNSTATAPHPASYTYDPYGGLASISESITNPFRFFGQYQDAESGYYYLRARYYDPATGQFLTCDPKVAITAQPYGYALDNPLSKIDPSGNDTTGKCIAAAASFWGFQASFQACVVIDDQGTIAATNAVSLGGGAAEPGLSVQRVNQYSNAKTVKDLAGPFGFVTVGAGVPVGPVPCAGSYTYEHGVNDFGGSSDIWVSEPGFGLGTPGVTAVTGVSNTTTVQPIVQLPSWAGKPAQFILNALPF